MELTNTRIVPAPPAAVWAALNDPAILKECLPGCESLERAGDNAFQAVMATRVGPVSARFTGRVTMSDIDPPNGYTLHFEGQGGAAGFARGEARITLAPEGDLQTSLHYAAKAQVGGKLAQIGSRLVDATAARMSAQFFQRLEQAIVSGAAEPAVVSPVAATSAGPAGKAAGEKTATNVAPGSVARPAIGAGVEDAVPAPPAPVMPPAPGAYQPGALVTLQMPAWTWAFTVAVVAAALLAAWLGR